MMPDVQKTMLFAGRLCIMLVLPVILGPILPYAARLYAQESEFYIENVSAYQDKSRTPVYFSHETHMETFECLGCHHDFQNGENVLDEDALDEDGSARCAACHSKGASIELRTAYHRQCMGCHRHVNKQEAARLPITCGDCHPRNPGTP
jgi:DNA-directed RNA polymerase subunit RPC12/RpoP